MWHGAVIITNMITALSVVGGVRSGMGWRGGGGEGVEWWRGGGGGVSEPLSWHFLHCQRETIVP